MATKDVDENFAIYNGDDVMLLPTIIQGAMGIVSGGAHIFGKEIRAIFEAFEKVKMKKRKSYLFQFIASVNQLARMAEYCQIRLYVLPLNW